MRLLGLMASWLLSFLAGREKQGSRDLLVLAIGKSKERDRVESELVALAVGKKIIRVRGRAERDV